MVVSVSLTMLVGCDDEGRAKTPSAASAEPTASATTTAKSATASPTVRAPYGFEMGPQVLNPKQGDRAVVLGGSGECYLFGPEDKGMSGVQFERLKVDCPEGIAATLGTCHDGILMRRGDRCACMSPEGNPPPPPQPAGCPD